MITTIHTLTNTTAEYVPNFIKNGFERAILHSGRFFSLLKETPQLMNKNQYVATTICVLVNGGLYFGVNKFANILDSISEDKKMNTDKRVKQFLINFIFVGGTVLTTNVILSKIVQYQMSNIELAVLTAGAIAIRYYSNCNKTE